MANAPGRPSGSRALDLVNTVDWRDDPARRVDLIPDAAALAAWARHAGYPRPTAAALAHSASLARVIKAREMLCRVFRPVAAGQVPPRAATAALVEWTRDAWRHRELQAGKRGLSWAWTAGTDAADRVLFDVVLEAGALLVSGRRDRIGVCAAPGCGWFFLDRSKAGRRRWCDMAVCGNRDKVRAYRARAAR